MLESFEAREYLEHSPEVFEILHSIPEIYSVREL